MMPKRTWWTSHPFYCSRRWNRDEKYRWWPNDAPPSVLSMSHVLVACVSISRRIKRKRKKDGDNVLSAEQFFSICPSLYVYRKHPGTHQPSANGHFSLHVFEKKNYEKRERERLILATAAGNVIRSPPPFFFSSPLTGTVGFRHFWVTLGHKMILQSDTRALFLLLLLFLYFVVVSVILDCCWSYVMPNNNNNIIVPAPNHILPSYIVLYAYMHVK